MAELADAQDLGSCVYSCRFKSCRPHQQRRVLLGAPFFVGTGDICAEPAASSNVQYHTVKQTGTRRDSERSESSLSCPVARTRKRQVSVETCRFQLYSPYGELYAPSVRDICFASDMPAGVRGEYNITETVGFNITFCVAKYITPSKTEYH